MPVIIPREGNREPLPAQHVCANCMCPCTAVLMEQMIFSVKIDQPVRITDGTAHRGVMVLRPVFFIIIAGCIRNISILKIGGSAVYDESRTPGHIRAVSDINSRRSIAIHKNLNLAPLRLHLQRMLRTRLTRISTT
ncbi:hypothetical protein D3C80_1376270 [compost metagenome]